MAHAVHKTEHAGAKNGLAQAERLAVVRDKLPSFLKGEFQPTTSEAQRAVPT